MILDAKSPRTPLFVYFQATLSSYGHIIFPNLQASKNLPEEQIFWGTDPLDASDGKRGTKQTKPRIGPWDAFQLKTRFCWYLTLNNRFLRKQNLKFPVTITEVVVLRGLPLLSKKKSHRKFIDHTRLKVERHLSKHKRKWETKALFPVLARVTLALIQTN